MNYKETLEYIQSLSKYGAVLGLDNMLRLCEKLGHPENVCKYIHVAGTNGKGSVSAYISQMLIASGYRVGRYSSPTITDYRERFQIGNRMITQKDLCIYMERMKLVCEELIEAGYPHPTPFEVETALCFLYFAEKQCDFVVLEVGMGGETDATNVISAPIACVWTSISMDHMHILGKSLSEIAMVKAGIGKKGALLISCKQLPDVEQILLKKAEELRTDGYEHPIVMQAEEIATQSSSKLIVADVAAATGIKYGLTTQQFSYKGLSRLKIHLAGVHQIANAVLAVEVMLKLREIGVDISDKGIYKGLEETKWQGRLEVLGKHPMFVLDGAHNEDAARQLAASIETYFKGKRIIYVMGVLKDKEYEKVLELTAGYAEHILTITPPDNSRALDALELAKAAREYHPQVTNLSSLEEALEVSHLLADKDTVILCFGSLSYLGAMKKLYEKRKL